MNVCVTLPLTRISCPSTDSFTAPVPTSLAATSGRRRAQNANTPSPISVTTSSLNVKYRPPYGEPARNDPGSP